MDVSTTIRRAGVAGIALLCLGGSGCRTRLGEPSWSTEVSTAGANISEGRYAEALVSLRGMHGRGVRHRRIPLFWAQAIFGAFGWRDELVTLAMTPGFTAQQGLEVARKIVLNGEARLPQFRQHRDELRVVVQDYLRSLDGTELSLLQLERFSFGMLELITYAAGMERQWVQASAGGAPRQRVLAILDVLSQPWVDEIIWQVMALVEMIPDLPPKTRQLILAKLQGGKLLSYQNDDLVIELTVDNFSWQTLDQVLGLAATHLAKKLALIEWDPRWDARGLTRNRVTSALTRALTVRVDEGAFSKAVSQLRQRLLDLEQQHQDVASTRDYREQENFPPIFRDLTSIRAIEEALRESQQQLPPGVDVPELPEVSDIAEVSNISEIPQKHKITEIFESLEIPPAPEGPMLFDGAGDVP